MGTGSKNIPDVRGMLTVRWSIGTKLVVAFLILAIIPMSAVAYYNLTQGKNEVTKIAKNGLISLSQSTAYSIDQLLIENQRNSVMLAGDPLTKQFIAASEKDRQILTPQIYKMMENFVDTHPDYDSPGLLDANGIVVAALEETLVGKDRSFRDYFQASIKGKSYVSDILIGRATGRPGVFLTNPVISAEGKIIGIVILWLKADTIWKIIDDVKVGKEGIAYLLDRDNVIIAHPSRKLLYHSIGELSSEAISTISSTIRFGAIKDTKKPVIPKNLGLENLAAQIASAQNPNTYHYSSPLNHRYHVVGYSFLKKQPWTVVIDLPEVQFLAPLNRMRTVAYVSIGLVAIITIIISIFLAKSITLPIRRLTAVSIEVKHDRSFNPSNIEDVIKGHDEIAQLGHMFSGMVLSLRESEAHLRTLIDTIPDLVWLKDPDGVYLSCNSKFEHFFGAKESDIVDKTDYEFVDKELADFFREKDKAVMDAKKPILNEEEIRYADDGHREVLETIKTPMYNSEGKLIGVLGIARDITERKKAEEEKTKLKSQLQQAQKMESIGTLTGGIAHDFNNILGIIVGNTGLALDDIPKWNSAYSSLEEIKKASLRAKNIVKQLLSFSRKTDQKLQPIQIALVIKDALKFLRSTIPTTINIHRNIQATDETILANPTQINQIIMNLCINASHAMEQTGGDLTIAVEKIALDDNSARDYPGLKRGNHVKIMISDTGPGIDPEIINQIFDPYFTTKEVGKGSGMGLAVVHGIVKSHSGAITVDSNPGKGAEFIMLFPLTTEKPMVEDKTTQDIPGGDETILFVDDEKSIVKMVQRMFERLGYKVETATTPQEALERFSLNPEHFDLVITDMTMPQMTGVKLSEKLRNIRKDIPIIVCTGYSTLVDEEKAKELGLAAFIMKPINMLETAQAIRKILDKK
jgi:PAS domain S-box-containing protein